MSDIKKEVEARAADIEAKAMTKNQPAPNEGPLDKNFVLDCMCSNTVGDAMLFRELFRGKYVFVQEWKKFLVWKGHYWEVDLLAKKPLADAERLCEAYQNAWAQTNEEEGSPLHKALEKKLRSLRSARGRKDMLECVTTIDDAPVISVHQLDQQPYLLATPDGVVDLRTGECNPGKPDQYITAVCPTRWTGLDTPCPEFEKYLFTCMAEDQEMCDFIQRLLGYGLQGDKDLAIWAIMYGPLSRNGKDTLMNVLTRILGKMHITISVQMLVEQKYQRDSSQPAPDLMALRGARMAYASEANGRHALDQAKIKWLTGGGQITARGLNDGEISQWKQNALLFLLTNYLPKIDASDDGFNERTICIEWPVKFVQNPTKEYERKIDHQMAKKLAGEDSGILAFLVRGCMDVIANGLRVPEKVKQYTREQIESFDDIGKFIKECCEVEEPPTGGRDFITRTPASDLLKYCNWWCKKILGNSYPYTPKKFTPALEKKGIPTRKSSIMYYMGITVKEETLREYDADMDELSKKDGRRL